MLVTGLVFFFYLGFSPFLKIRLLNKSSPAVKGYLIYRDKLDENENKYYYVLFVQVATDVMVTVVVKNEVEIQFEIQIQIANKLQIQISN